MEKLIQKKHVIPMLIGPVMTILTTVLLVQLTEHEINIPPMAIYTLLVVFGTYTGGWISGSITALLGILTIRIYLSQVGAHSSIEEPLRFWIATASMPILIWLVGRLKHRSEKLFEIEKKSAIVGAKLKEQQIAAKQMMLVQYTVDHALESIRIIREDGMIIYANTKARQIFGHLDAAHFEHKVWECDRTFTAESWRAHWAQMATNGMTRYEITVFDPQEKEIWLEMLDDYVHDGETGYIVSHGRDITGRHLAEEQIRKLNQDLESRIHERTQKLESINKELEAFTYSISHDLKAPLRAINGFTGMLIEEYAGKMDDGWRDKLLRIRESAQNMREMVDDLLLYSRVERRTQSGQVVQIDRLARDLLRERAAEIEQWGIRVELDIPFETVVADIEGLRQVLRNLIDNAIKFTRRSEPAEIEISGEETGTARIVRVRDNGIGFEMKYHDRIFELFQRLHADQEYPGTGLGLSIVHKAMEKMGGKVYAQSAPNQGATFFLEFPKAPAPLDA